ncbi:MAG TPA: response regulator transcription factor [Terriglobales bacterium]|nr:response regulator transcription factor [Terriglobales bacterium]
MTTPVVSALDPLIVIERRAASGARLVERFREAGFAARLEKSLTEAARGSTVVWMLPASDRYRDWLPTLRSHAGRVRLLTVGREFRVGLQVELLLAGAAGYVDQNDGWSGAIETMIKAARAVMAGGRWFSSEVMSASIDALRDPARKPAVGAAFDSLSPRELQIARHVALGESNKQIAAALNLAECTVKTHLQNVFAKINVNNRVTLALYATRNADRV